MSCKAATWSAGLSMAAFAVGLAKTTNKCWAKHGRQCLPIDATLKGRPSTGGDPRHQKTPIPRRSGRPRRWSPPSTASTIQAHPPATNGVHSANATGTGPRPPRRHNSGRHARRMPTPPSQASRPDRARGRSLRRRRDCQTSCPRHNPQLRRCTRGPTQPCTSIARRRQPSGASA